MNDSPIHHYPWYVADWKLSETRIRLSSAGRGMFRELLDYCWIEGSLPADQQALLSISGGTRKEFDREWPVMDKCFHESSGRLYHRKVDGKRPSLVAAVSQRRQAGGKGGERRAANQASARASGEAKDQAVVQALTGAVAVAGREPPAPFDGIVERTVCEFRELHPRSSFENLVALFFGGQFLRLGEDSARFSEWVEPIRRSHIAWCAYWQLDGGKYTEKLEDWLAKQGWTKSPPCCTIAQETKDY